MSLLWEPDKEPEVGWKHIWWLFAGALLFMFGLFEQIRRALNL